MSALQECRGLLSTARQIFHSKKEGGKTHEHQVYGLQTAGRYDGLVIIGGDTSRAACAMFGATTISLHSEIESGTAYGLICDGEIKGMPIVTKSGAFGTPQTLKVAVDYMRA